MTPLASAAKSTPVNNAASAQPVAVNLAEQRRQIHAAHYFTRRLATSHYENFTVVSCLLPRPLHQDFYNIYAFCRHADDLADEIADKQASLAALNDFEAQLRDTFADKRPHHPILLALQGTARKYDIPIDPFLALISAFVQDQHVQRYETFAQLMDYCRRSANPVGHLVLYLGGYRDAHRQRLSDHTCSALQLANFWQDVLPDLSRDRIYIPREDMARFGVSESDILAKNSTPQFIQMMRFQVDRAMQMFTEGQQLLPLLDRRLKLDVELYIAGGQAILTSLAKIGYNPLRERPSLSRWDKMRLMANALCRRLF